MEWRCRFSAGATLQIMLFGVMAIQVKRKAPNCHTILEVVRLRWGVPRSPGTHLQCIQLAVHQEDTGLAVLVAKRRVASTHCEGHRTLGTQSAVLILSEGSASPRTTTCKREFDGTKITWHCCRVEPPVPSLSELSRPTGNRELL